MKQVTLTQLRRKTAQQIRDGGCFEVLADGERVAIVIVGAIEEMRQAIVGRASQIDLARGK